MTYNVKYKFKNNESISEKELKDLLNKKMLNIILKLETENFRLNNS